MTALWRQGFRLFVVILCLLAGSLQAQELELPLPEELAAALAAPDLRNDTLLTMIAVARLLEYGVAAELTEIDEISARFRDDRAWLDRLAGRHLDLTPRGPQLDPAAWFVLLELDKNQLAPDLAASPLGPEYHSMMLQLFDHSNEQLAAAVLPEVLQRTEFRAMAQWKSLVEQVMVNEVLFAVVSGLASEWFVPWFSASLPADSFEDAEAGAIDEALLGLWALAGSAMSSGPPDAERLKALRFRLLLRLPDLAGIQSRDARYLLALASAVDGLNEGKYLAFTEALLWVASELLMPEQQVSEWAADPLFEPLFEPAFELQHVPAQGPRSDPVQPDEAEVETVPPEAPARSRVPRILSELLPRFSNAFASEFSGVDPRINANLAAVFDAVQYLQGEQQDPERLRSLRRAIGNAVGQLVLLVPEMNYYFDQPVRRPITSEINDCITAASNRDQQGAVNLGREQFDRCLENLVEMSAVLARREELAGDPDGPFGSDQLRRELMMPPWQRINFSLGYLYERFPSGCEPPESPLPNPLEWSSLATMTAWFARQAPVYFQTPENEERIVRMRQLGLEMLKTMVQQVDCISGAGTGIHDPVSRSLADYRQALENLVAGIREAELKFRENRLKPGSDIVLHGDASQRTAYRTEELTIGPCDAAQVCEMSGELETTRALIGLFPDAYLIADQTKLGRIEICYENMQWVNRRAVPVRADDPHVANYFGQLSFDLVGRYEEKGITTKVFGSNFVSPDEYHYLFAAATEEVQQDSCPTEWVGSKIVTGLGGDSKVRVVPDRLTYLAASRETPSGVISTNWSRGAEWRDRFVTGLGVTAYEYELDAGISSRVNQHLQSLYQAEQSVLYTALLTPQSRGGNPETGSLLDLQEELTARKDLVRAYINLFYPDFMMSSDEIRGSLEGYEALLDSAVLRRFREANVAMASINEAGLARLENFQANWTRQSDAVRRSGSVAPAIAHAIIRLNALYREFFVIRAGNSEIREEAISPAGGRGD